MERRSSAPPRFPTRGSDGLDPTDPLPTSASSSALSKSSSDADPGMPDKAVPLVSSTAPNGAGMHLSAPDGANSLASGLPQALTGIAGDHGTAWSSLTPPSDPSAP